MLGKFITRGAISPNAYAQDARAAAFALGLQNSVENYFATTIEVAIGFQFLSGQRVLGPDIFAAAAFEDQLDGFQLEVALGNLQRHRLLTLEWQPLSTRHGYTEPDALGEAGALDGWNRVMDASADLYEAMRSAGLHAAAPYAVAMAYRVRFYMDMNAREAMHVIELRTAPQGHPAYRRVCQQMHRLIAERAGHAAIAETMKYADHSEVELERLKAERELERKRKT